MAVRSGSSLCTPPSMTALCALLWPWLTCSSCQKMSTLPQPPLWIPAPAAVSSSTLMTNQRRER
jgi:hypothetical protein